MRCNMRWQRLNQYICVYQHWVHTKIFMSICFFMCVQCTHSSQSSIDKRAFTFRGQSITKPNCNKGRPKSNRNRYLSAYKTGFIATLFDMLISKKKIQTLFCILLLMAGWSICLHLLVSRWNVVTLNSFELALYIGVDVCFRSVYINGESHSLFYSICISLSFSFPCKI